MVPLEFARIVLFPESDPGSALKLWSHYFPDREPSTFETTEGGQTHARGPMEGYWLQISREGKKLSLYFSPEERVSGHAPIKNFDSETVPFSAIKEFAAKMCVHVGSQGIESHLYASQEASSLDAALSNLRNSAPDLSFPASTNEAEFRIRGVIPCASVSELALEYQCLWRNGSRVISVDGERSSAPALGVVIQIRTAVPVDAEEDTHIEVMSPRDLVHEVIDTSVRVWKEGRGAL